MLKRAGLQQVYLHDQTRSGTPASPLDTAHDPDDHGIVEGSEASTLLRAGLVLATLGLLGCHLIFPYDKVVAQDGPSSDAFAVEAGPADGAWLLDAPGPEAGGTDGSADAATDSPVSEPPVYDWHYALGGSLSNRSEAVALDGNGNVYLVGSFSGNGDLGGDELVSRGDDIFVTSFSATGSHRWQKRIGGAFTDAGQSIAVDGDDNVYLTGRFSGTADLGDGSSIGSAGDNDIFLTSYSAGGVHRWQQQLGGVESDMGNGLAVDRDGNVYLTGTFSSTADLGGGDLTSKGSAEIFITSFTAAGGHRWQKRLGGVESDMGNGLAVDRDGNVYLTGKFSGLADLGGGDLTSKGSADIFITSFTNIGTHRWQEALGGTSTDTGWGVAVDTNGNVYLTGACSGTVDLGGGDVMGKGSNSDIFITSFSANGVHRWQKVLGSGYAGFGSGLATDGHGNVYLTGKFRETADLGGGNVIAAGSEDLFVTSFTALGAHRWQMALGGTAVTVGRGVAVDGIGAVYLTGYFSGTTNLGGGDVTAQALLTEIFVVRLRP